MASLTSQMITGIIIVGMIQGVSGQVFPMGPMPFGMMGMRPMPFMRPFLPGLPRFPGMLPPPPSGIRDPMFPLMMRQQRLRMQQVLGGRRLPGGNNGEEVPAFNERIITRDPSNRMDLQERLGRDPFNTMNRQERLGRDPFNTIDRQDRFGPPFNTIDRPGRPRDVAPQAHSNTFNPGNLAEISIRQLSTMTDQNPGGIPGTLQQPTLRESSSLTQQREGVVDLVDRTRTVSDFGFGGFNEFGQAVQDREAPTTALASINSLALLERPASTHEHNTQNSQTLQDVQGLQTPQNIQGIGGGQGVQGIGLEPNFDSAQNVPGLGGTNVQSNLIPSVMLNPQTNSAALSNTVGTMDRSGRFTNLLALTPTNAQQVAAQRNDLLGMTPTNAQQVAAHRNDLLGMTLTNAQQVAAHRNDLLQMAGTNTQQLAARRNDLLGLTTRSRQVAAHSNNLVLTPTNVQTVAGHRNNLLALAPTNVQQATGNRNSNPLGTSNFRGQFNNIFAQTPRNVRPATMNRNVQQSFQFTG